MSPLGEPGRTARTLSSGRAPGEKWVQGETGDSGPLDPGIDRAALWLDLKSVTSYEWETRKRELSVLTVT